MKNKSLVEGLDDCKLKFNFCKQCIYGKKHCFFLILVLVSILGFWILFMQISLVLLTFLHYLDLCILSHSYMTIVKGHLYISLGVNLKFLVGLKNSNSWLKTRLVKNLSVWGLMMVVSFFLAKFTILCIKTMVLRNTKLLHTPIIK